MSYWVSLECKDGNWAKVEIHSEGGTYALGGTDQAKLNVTYNYSWFYYHFLDEQEGIRWLDGKTAKDCISRLENAVEVLGTSRYDKDYWAATPGNAGYVLNVLLGWARQHPDARFTAH